MPAATRSALVLLFGSIALDAKVEVKSDWLGVIWDSANLAPTPNPYKELAV